MIYIYIYRSKNPQIASQKRGRSNQRSGSYGSSTTKTSTSISPSTEYYVNVCSYSADGCHERKRDMWGLSLTKKENETSSVTLYYTCILYSTDHTRLGYRVRSSASRRHSLYSSHNLGETNKSVNAIWYIAIYELPATVICIHGSHLGCMKMQTQREMQSRQTTTQCSHLIYCSTPSQVSQAYTYSMYIYQASHVFSNPSHSNMTWHINKKPSSSIHPKIVKVVCIW